MSRHVHFIGIGGSGLSAIATVLLERGDFVSGSDRQESSVTRHLQEAGVMVFVGHRPENVAGADLVVRSSAIKEDNPEVQAAHSAGMPVLRRADFLSYLIGGQRAITVAGTHGKTTTTAMIAWILHYLGLDPSYVIGGRSNNLGGNAHSGAGDFFVIEADEYDRMFLGLQPYIAVLTSVEHDHPDCFPTPGDFQRAFEEFLDRLDADGVLIGCIDDPGALRLMERAKSRGYQTLGYSTIEPSANYFAGNLRLNPLGCFDFELSCHGTDLHKSIRMQVPGRHNIANALAAIAAADQLGQSLDRILEACEKFLGAGRRFELRGVEDGVTLIDDYAHHPTEIRTALAAARVRYSASRIWAVWQPHTYSRARRFMDAFRSSFTDADRVVVTEIFAAREQPPEDGFSGRSIAEMIAEAHPAGEAGVVFRSNLSDAVKYLSGEVRSGDVVLVLSAGDADQIIDRLILEIGKRKG